MPIKVYNPTSPGRRNGSVIDYRATLTKTKPEKSLCERLIKTGGRNHHGKITAKHRGGGNKKLYRKVDFKRNKKDGIDAVVESIEYDPNRTCFIALLQYEDGEKAYILAPVGLEVGRKVQNGEGSAPEVGNCMPLANIPTGLTIHNIELNPGQGGKLVRSAGNAARLAAKEGQYVVIILPSGEQRRIRSECRATIGQVGNTDHQNVKIGKAGRSRHMGIRPHTRAKAMNPIDHPLGGGEGRSNGGRHPVSRSGVPSKGGVTRDKKKASEKFILRRRKMGKHQPRKVTVNA
jgi:large subunit ribosomal protein L2